MKNKLISIDKAIDLIKDGDTVMYGGFIGTGTPETIVDGIVERKIASFDAQMLEKLIFGIMKKELKAIVYLGAALGFLMGFVNLLW